MSGTRIVYGIKEAAMVAAQQLHEEKNPFELSVEEQLNRLRAANDAGNWGLKEEEFKRLAETAPAWPKGFDSFRGIRVRLGEGRDGVIKTFEAHAAEIERVFVENERCQPMYRFFGNRNETGRLLRLLNGNDTHKPCVEWFTTDLSENREWESITLVRGPKSLSDDGLSLAWMFPERVKAIDYDELAAWFLAGYELNVPEYGDGDWQCVPLVNFYRDRGQVRLNGGWYSYDDSDRSVPVSRE